MNDINDTSRTDAMKIAWQLVIAEYDADVSEEAMIAHSASLIEPILRQRDNQIAKLESEIRIMLHVKTRLEYQHAVAWLLWQPDFSLTHSRNDKWYLWMGETRFEDLTPIDVIEKAYEELYFEPARQASLAAEPKDK